MSTKKLVIFDFDGVLFDSSRLASAYIQGMYPAITDDIMNEILSENFHEGMSKLTLPKIEETEEERRVRKQAYLEKKRITPLFPGIRELLTELAKREVILAINTSAVRESCVPLLENQEIAHLFDYVGTKEISPSKTEKFSLILEHFNLVPEDTIFVTDTLGDLKEALVVEVPTIAVTYGAQPREYFTKEPYANLVAIVDTVGELREKLFET
jgi:phosphoglycolate phosphatase